MSEAHPQGRSGVRQEQLAAVRTRLKQVAARGDPSLLLESAALNEARQLAETLNGTRGDLEAFYMLGLLHWYRSQALGRDNGRQDLHVALQMFTPCFISGISELPEPLLAVLAERAVPVATALLGEIQGTAAAESLVSVTVDLWQRILSVIPTGHPDRAGYLSNLGIALQAQFGWTGVRADLDAAIEVGRAAVDAAQPNDCARFLSNLGTAFYSRFERTGVPTDLDAAIEVCQAAVDTALADDPGRPRYFSNLAGALIARFRRTGERADLDSAIEITESAVAAADHPNRAGFLSNLGTALRTRFELTGEQADLDAAIESHQAALNTTPANHPDRATFLSNLGSALLTRFRRSGTQSDLDAAVETAQAAVAVIPADHPDRGWYLFSLGNALQARFEQTGIQPDLDAAVETVRAAVAATPADHPERARYLSSLGTALQARFEQTGAKADLDAAIQAAQIGVETTPPEHEDRAGCLSNLGIALRARFGETGDLADLDAAIEAMEAAVAATPVGHLDRPRYLSNAGVTLRLRFERTGSQADLDAAIEAHQAAVNSTAAGHSDWAMMLSNLGAALQLRFERTGSQADLDAAIEANRAAVNSGPAGHTGLAGTVFNLGAALRARFERTGSQADLDAAIEADLAIVAITPAGHPRRPAYLSSLGLGLRARFERTGAQNDLNEAIKVSRDAVAATPAGHPDRAGRLSNLGIALNARFERVGSQADLDAAIEAHQAAVAATPAGHPDRAGRLSNLGIALNARFERVGSQADLDAAIEAHQAAVAATPANHPRRAVYLSNLGLALRARSVLSGSQADLDAAIGAHQAAVAATPADHPNRLIYMSNAGVALQIRSVLSGSQADLDAAIETYQAALAATPVNHPNRAGRLSNLGIALQARAGRTGSQTDLAMALSACAEAAEVDSAAPSVRIRAARAAGALAARSAPGRAADLLEAAVRLLPEVAPRQLERSDQQHVLGGLAGLAGEAAALALADPGTTILEGAARALRLLEAGRAVLLSQTLETRSDLTELRLRYPDLAARFVELRFQLDLPSGESVPITALADSPGRMIEDRQDVATEFAVLLEQIRGLDGFASFGLPPAANELLAQAVPGPVVTFSVSDHRCDALLLTHDGISSIELPSLTRSILFGKIVDFHQALYLATDSDASSVERRAAQTKLREILEWLWDTTTGPVLEALDLLHQPRPGEAWPRIWWAPGGLLGLLPLHAAGYHSDLHRESGGPAVIDRVISSYTPTIRALGYARQHVLTATDSADRALIVAMPTTPGIAGRLHNVPAEATMLAGRLHEPVVLIEPDAMGDDSGSSSDTVPTKANVLACLPGSSVVHFACHGASHPSDPSRSLLLLHDYKRDPFTVASLAHINLGDAQLAYLSACRTAFTANVELIDEAIHLTTAFQLAGFPQVIGTLWEINDEVAVEVADTFYARLQTELGGLNASQAAEALHHAVRMVRDRLPRTPYLWAAYVHAGA